MKMIPDRSGRFPERPYYTTDELEIQCEQLIESFLVGRYGQFVIPVPTQALAVMIEDEAAKFNMLSDLSDEGDEVHGVTDFFPGKKPEVRIARELSHQFWREHRLRSTLPHEYGHVHWHTWLYDRYCDRGERHKCLRGEILPGNAEIDWMEWQAGYISGALLMPKSRVDRYVNAFCAKRSVNVPFETESVDGRVLIKLASELFNVSVEAANVRLRQLRHLLS
ncbi:MAG TPA: hypothetical protein VMA09_06260 [Candidatus Binataceae bacterium]|nr:hypothetical protein [Candidatus Binataceae bacterium]